MATIASLLADHVTLQVRSVDRLFLQGYVARLMTEGMVVRFRKGESKEQVAQPYLERAETEGRTGVVMLGVAQEKTSAWRGWRDGGPDGHPHFCFGRQTVFVNHYYFYVLDPDWGPAFIKTCAYAPFPIWLCLNGHEWAKRQARRRGLRFEALDNGFRSCADAEALASICAALSARHVEGFLRRFKARLPSPFTPEDRRRGYGYALAFGQLELSDTRVFDRPQAGRAWFEQTIRDQLTLGRPITSRSSSAGGSPARPPGASRPG